MNIIGTTEISYEIEQMLKDAEKFLILVTPYLKLNQRLKVKISDAFQNIDDVFVLYRDNQNDDSDIQWFTNFKNVEVFSIKNLHSKIYLNENSAIISSMNLYEYSQINNHEIGVKLDFKTNTDEYKRCLDEIRIISETEYTNEDLINFQSIFDIAKDFSMRRLFNELTSQYSFKNFKSGSHSQRLYEFISDEARKITRFEKNELYQNETAILRCTNLGRERYKLLQKELKKIAN